MTRRDKLILVENICMYASGLFLVWFAASFVDVLAHNMSDYNYAWWNFFQLWFQGVAMKNLIRVVVWFFVINFSICNTIWTEPVDYWWLIEIIVLGISILMVDKPFKKQYNDYSK